MPKIRNYFVLALYPLGFFSILAMLQSAIIWHSYNQAADRQLGLYMNGQPLPEVRQKIDRRPQSITIPSFH